ncbi:sigma-E processing peptidase SpoIIGA [uncultured Clostridium sp.]|uniref:sigma-E processing peptidase SpoIIGA n=1 Tax=uncultured Clostridium sp. TaxID=59620 RepID=UPI0025F5CDF5|nr:sigma-E processing peptidase SpoIIGA [uncultured Clostridium sp.]
MIVYADIFFIENFIVNLFLLYVTMKCLKHKFKFSLLSAGACIGSLYGFVMVIPKVKFLAVLPFELLTAYLMLRVVYGKTAFINMLKVLITFLMLTFTLSGICFLFSLKQNYYILNGTFKIEKYSVKYIMLGLMIIFIFADRIIGYIKDKVAVSSYIYVIEFQIEGKMYSFQGFLDTGNELREPVTNLPCILIEEKLFSLVNFKDKNIYSIPYNAIGYGGQLKGIRVNNIKIKGRDLWYRQVDAIVCPCMEKLSKENEFNALLSRGIL